MIVELISFFKEFDLLLGDPGSGLYNWIDYTLPGSEELVEDSGVFDMLQRGACQAIGGVAMCNIAIMVLSLKYLFMGPVDDLERILEKINKDLRVDIEAQDEYDIFCPSTAAMQSCVVAFLCYTTISLLCLLTGNTLYRDNPARQAQHAFMYNLCVIIMLLVFEDDLFKSESWGLFVEFVGCWKTAIQKAAPYPRDFRFFHGRLSPWAVPPPLLKNKKQQGKALNDAGEVSSIRSNESIGNSTEEEPDVIKPSAGPAVAEPAEEPAFIGLLQNWPSLTSLQNRPSLRPPQIMLLLAELVKGLRLHEVASTGLLCYFAKLCRIWLYVTKEDYIHVKNLNFKWDLYMSILKGEMIKGNIWDDCWTCTGLGLVLMDVARALVVLVWTWEEKHEKLGAGGEEVYRKAKEFMHPRRMHAQVVSDVSSVLRINTICSQGMQPPAIYGLGRLERPSKDATPLTADFVSK
ncbi:hypothetical protein PENSPDRAFT_671856 [Peniophora sp. CONT]|nr:hypothetical protein PENSPDRAFT_671856 [Peniophora sp. CONT]